MKKLFLVGAGMMAGVAFGATETIDGMTYEPCASYRGVGTESR